VWECGESESGQTVHDSPGIFKRENKVRRKLILLIEQKVGLGAKKIVQRGLRPKGFREYLLDKHREGQGAVVAEKTIERLDASVGISDERKAEIVGAHRRRQISMLEVLPIGQMTEIGGAFCGIRIGSQQQRCSLMPAKAEVIKKGLLDALASAFRDMDKDTAMLG
jgi:hypothetical protein